MNELIRPASVADADAIAALHAASWRSAYRGIFKDSTLGPILDDDRRRHWSSELAAMTPADTVLIADGSASSRRGRKAIRVSAPISTTFTSIPSGGGRLGRRLLGEAMRRVADAARGAPISGCSTTTCAPSNSIGGWAARSSKAASKRSRGDGPAKPHRLARHCTTGRGMRSIRKIASGAVPEVFFHRVRSHHCG